MTYSQEVINTIALTRINYFSLTGLLELYRRMGSATAIIDNRSRLREVMPDASQRLVDALADIDGHLSRAEEEVAYDETHAVEAITMNDDRYPQRLRECDDAPLMLFYKGTADLNRARVISIVGTRRCTSYGQDIIHRFCDDLRRLCPDTLIISGLAYGVDVSAHRNALASGFETAAVLAHGLDTIYPSSHRSVAEEMLRQGGLVTEFLTRTPADKMNFVRRNRIVAGMADAVIVVESAAKGGGLITARIGRSYNRDVFAFPGAVGAQYSEGCNNMIRDNEAGLITCAADFVAAMGWKTQSEIESAREAGIQRQIFPDLTDDEQRIVDVLTRSNNLQLSMIAVQSGLAVATTAALLFSLEMKGVLKMYAGGTYHLLS